MQIKPRTEEQKEKLLNEDGTIRWRTQYSPARDQFEGEEAVIYCDDPHLTEQHHAAELDLNNIVQRYGIKDGSLPPAAVYPENFFGDFTDVADFRTAVDRIKDAADRFNLLPASLRGRFENDPAKMYEWVLDAANIDEAEKLGLIKREMIRQEPPANAGDPSVSK